MALHYRNCRDPKRPMKTIVLDAMGVIYSVGDDVQKLLCPFIVEKGGLRNAEQIHILYRAASLGKMSAREFWQAVSVAPELEKDYLARHRLTDGVLSLLDTLHRHGYLIWCLSNDISEWSLKLRHRFGLNQFIRGFLISGDIGIRKPDPAIFERLVEQSGTTAEEIVFVDDNLANLNVAATLGIRTILFTSSRLKSEGQHLAVHSCDQLVDVLMRPQNRH